ncbi:MAG: HU family DNA-binding protein [Chrysiogenales bacterium]|nr:MAG: HU family DNA-binding protein [Chrysiogenales bacterium]
MAKKTAAKVTKAGKESAAQKKVMIPEKFTAQTILKYITEKHELPRVKAKEIMDDIFGIIHAGVLKGERVPVGNFGKLHIKLKPATKERMGRNPITGEEIMISAKKATKVPKFTFSKNYKETALKATIKK